MNRKICIRLLALCAALCSLQAAAQDSSPQLQSLLESGQIDQAINQLEGQLGSNPYDPVDLNNLAVARAGQGDVYMALDLLRRALRLAPGQPVISRNYDKLRNWLAARIGAADSMADVNERRPPPSRLPDPPPLWN